MQKEKKPETQGAKVLKAIINTVINVLIVVVLIVSVLVAVLALTSKANNGVPSIFGYSFHTIQTASMQGGSDKYEGGDYEPGDLIIGKVMNGNPNEVYEVGDIVVYTTQDDTTPQGVQMIAHRIVEVEESEGGVRYYTTKGDNNADADPAPHTASDIVSVCYDHDYEGAKLKGFGKTLDFLRTGTGFFFVVLLPMIIFFLYEIIRVVLNTLNYKKAKSVEDKEEAERQKQEAIDAAVKAALNAQKSADTDVNAGDGAREIPASQPAAESSSAPEMTAEELEQFRQFQAFQKMQKEQQEQNSEE